jgi:hypothetical protein
MATRRRSAKKLPRAPRRRARAHVIEAEGCAAGTSIVTAMVARVVGAVGKSSATVPARRRRNGRPLSPGARAILIKAEQGIDLNRTSVMRRLKLALA